MPNFVAGSLWNFIMHLKNIVSTVASAAQRSHVNVGAIERLASIAAGTLLTAYGIKRSSLAGYGIAGTGAALLFRGVTGYCPVNAAVGRDSTGGDQGHDRVEIRTRLTVDKPREEVYAFWRRLENLPQFMKHISEVRQTGARRSAWSAPIPMTDTHLEWESEIEAEDENSRLAWHSVAGSGIENSGEVRFEDAPGGRGTVLNVYIFYAPPAGDVGAAAAGLLTPAFEQMVKEDVRRFKRVIETGEIPSTAGQSSGAH